MIKKPIFYLLLAYFIVVLFKILLSSLVPYPLYLSDERWYLEMSRNFFNKGNFFVDYNQNMSYPPLYPILLLPNSFLDKISAIPLIKIINAFVSTTIIFPMYLMSKEFLKKKTAVTIATLSLFIPDSFVLSFTIMSENLFYPLFIFSIYLMLKSITTQDKKWDILCGLFVGLTILTRMIGLTLFLAVPLILFIKSFLNKKILKEKFKTFFSSVLNKYSFFLVLIFIITPWFLRNIYYFGSSIQSLFGYTGIEKTSDIFNKMILFDLINFIFIYVGYVTFSTGILFFALTIHLTQNLKNYRNKTLTDFILIVWVLFIIFISVCTYWSFTDLSGAFTGMGEKIMGRYIGPILPLFLITGGIELILYRQNDRQLFISFLICFLFLVFLPTNQMIASFDTLSSMIIYTPKYLFEMAILPLQISSLFVRIILIIIPFIFFISRNYILKWKTCIFLTFLFLITSSVVATVAMSIGSYDAEEYMKFSLYMRSNIPKDAVILIDKRTDNLRELAWIKEAVDFWTDNEVYVGNFYNFDKKIDYIISNNDLDLTLISKLEATEGIFNPKTETLYLYKK